MSGTPPSILGGFSDILLKSRIFNIFGFWIFYKFIKKLMGKREPKKIIDFIKSLIFVKM